MPPLCLSVEHNMLEVVIAVLGIKNLLKVIDNIAESTNL